MGIWLDGDCVKMKVKELLDFLKQVSEDTEIIMVNSMGASSVTEPCFDVVERGGRVYVAITHGDEIKE